MTPAAIMLLVAVLLVIIAIVGSLTIAPYIMGARAERRRTFSDLECNQEQMCDLTYREEPKP